MGLYTLSHRVGEKRLVTRSDRELKAIKVAAAPIQSERRTPTTFPGVEPSILRCQMASTHAALIGVNSTPHHAAAVPEITAARTIH